MSAGCYLLHFDQPVGHARHYLGSARNIEARIKKHANGTGGRLTEVAKERGIGFTVAREWITETEAEARTLEIKLKGRKHGQRGRYTTGGKRNCKLCPICTGEEVSK